MSRWVEKRTGLLDGVAARRGGKYNGAMTSKKLSHLDDSGRARMVDVGEKTISERWAVARGEVHMSPDAYRMAAEGDLKKGDLVATAELAGVMGAKETAHLIPLCHPLELSQIEVNVDLDEALPGARITATARTRARTGVEMEALTAVSIAALTIYDMIKAVEKTARIRDIRLVEKHGGRSGDVVLE